MTEIATIEKYVSLLPNLKILVVDGSGETGYTYDTDMDAAHGAGAEFKEIFDAYHVTDAGVEKSQATWSASTGVVTIGGTDGGTDFKLFIVGK